MNRLQLVLLTAQNKLASIIFGTAPAIGKRTTGTADDFENAITKPIEKGLDLLFYLVAVGGVVSILMGVVELKDAMSTDGAPATKKKSAIIKIGFGIVLTTLGGFLAFLGIDLPV